MSDTSFNSCELERKNLEVISELLADYAYEEAYASIIKHCIHTTADFDYAGNLYFSENALNIFKNLFKNGCRIITDTQMTKAGVNKKLAHKYGIKIKCFIDDDDVALEASERNLTRHAVAVEKAMRFKGSAVFVVGDAPLALMRLYEAVCQGYRPAAVIAAPVGFVNVAEAKEMIIRTDIPCIAARGRKGGSSIAAAICNAILYEL